MDFTPIPPSPNRTVIQRVPVNPNPTPLLITQTPQQRIEDVRQMITIWRGRQIQYQQQGAGG
jgi:hypothetical protein